VNPFDLRGPEFLVFYLALGLATLAIVWFLRRTNESDSTVSPILNDYLEIAYLRGGANEALRVATMNLINRGLIDIKTDDRLHTLDPKAHVLVSKDSERGILEKFTVAQAATQIFSDKTLRRTVTDECQPTLARMGLVPDASRQAARAVLLFAGACLLTAVAGIKILVALSRGRSNIAFLIIAAAVFCVLLYKATSPLRTPTGNALLADLRTLFAGLRERGGSLVQGVDTQDSRCWWQYSGWVRSRRRSASIDCFRRRRTPPRPRAAADAGRPATVDRHVVAAAAEAAAEGADREW
jgi:uncharacterized protein (TIGR04222 family)